MVKEIIITEIEKLKESGSINSDSEILLNFNEYIRLLGLDVTFSIFKTADSSKIGRTINNQYFKIPIINIYVNTTDNLIKNGVEQSDSNWNGKYKYTEKIVSKWNELANFYNYPNSYKSLHIYVFIYSLEQLVINLLVRFSKNEIVDLVDMLSPCQPEYVFCSSEPAYNIIFKNEKDYKLFNLKYRKLLISNIHEVLRKNNPFIYLNKTKVKVNFFHKNMDNFNLYGLSREG